MADWRTNITLEENASGKVKFSFVLAPPSYGFEVYRVRLANESHSQNVEWEEYDVTDVSL